MSGDWNFPRNTYPNVPVPTSTTPIPLFYATSSAKPPSTVGIFTPFYISVAVCSLILGSIIILNVICCCTRYRKYWLDKYTGNLWLATIWTATPHKTPPLDLHELEQNYIPVKVVTQTHSQPRDYLGLQKRESDL